MSILENHHVQFFLAAAISLVGVLCLYGVAYFIRRYLRLRHIPGPGWAKWTDLGLIFKFRVLGQNFEDIALDLDRQYGPVVKYGPSRVLFSDLSAAQIIYGTANVFDKADSYDIPNPVINGKVTSSIVTLRDEKFVTQLRRHLNPIFTTTSILEYEHHIDDTISTLCDHLGRSPTCNLAALLSYFTNDTICRLAFTDDQNAMGQGKDPHGMIKGGFDRFQYWSDWFSISWLDYLINKNPLLRSSSKPPILTAMAMERVQERIEKGGPNGGAGSGVHQDLLDQYFRGRDKSPEIFTIPMITGITLATIHAGSDTTAQTLMQLFWTLFQNPEAYKKLKKECREADLSSPPKFDEAKKKLTYLEACVKESQRLHYLPITPLERVVPKSGATISGVFVPGGTIVTINHQVLARDPSIYGPQVDQFRPERWIECTDLERAQMERASFAFSHGKRMCLGIHLAWAEILKTVPELLRRFDIELEDKNFKPKLYMNIARFMKELPVTVTPRVQGEKLVEVS